MQHFLGFLTNDVWEVNFIGQGYVPKPPKRPIMPVEDCVSLLSGGLDSFVGNVDLAAAGKKPFAISQTVVGDAKNQREFAKIIGGGLRHLQMNHNADVPKPEKTLVMASGPGANPAIPFPGAKRISLAGDSTVNHTTGWGSAFCERMGTDVECFNSSRNGRSAKSYREQGLWARALADYIFIQFGANDGPGKGPLLETVPETTYSDYMRDYIREARVQGTIPILVTPLPQRQYKDGKHVRTLEDYAAAMRKVGKETNTIVLDLNAEANDALDAMTEEQAHEFNYNVADSTKPGKDTTHLNARGGEFFGLMVAKEFAAAVPSMKVNTR